MAVNKAKFRADLRKHKRAGFDTSLFIYHLEDIEPYADLCEIAFGAVAGNSLQGIWSTITVTELLTKPFAHGLTEQLKGCEQFIHSFANARLVPLDYAIAREAGRLRGKYKLKTPDALLVATSLKEKAGAFITNDGGLRKLKAEGIVIMVLDDYLKTSM